ncbi:hypothetical protein GGI23_004888 [Coemansia sp. RSA 2559]|nr:hypothetical protein GGI23_004888 [Coemansia sp. RSA 2559]
MLSRRLPMLTTHYRRCLSTVEAGTAFENLTTAAFNRLGAQVERVGGAGDQGVDFRGPWSLPNHERFYVVGQCKHYERKRIGPSVIREWEGVMSRQDYDTVGVVVASSGFTAESAQVALSSMYPMALVTLAAEDIKVAGDAPQIVAEGRRSKARISKQGIRGFIWNKAADPFIGRLVVAKKHYDVHVYDLDDPAEFTIQLLWDGKPLPEL